MGICSGLYAFLHLQTRRVLVTTATQRRYALIGRREFSYGAEVFLLFAGLLALQGFLIVLRLNPFVQSVLNGSGISKGVYHLWLLGTVDLPLILIIMAHWDPRRRRR